MATNKYNVEFNLVTKGLEGIKSATDAVKGLKAPEAFTTSINNLGINVNKTLTRIKSQLNTGIIDSKGLGAIESQLSKLIEQVAKHTKKPLSQMAIDISKEIEELRKKSESSVEKARESSASAKKLKSEDLRPEFGLTNRAPNTPETITSKIESLSKKLESSKNEETRVENQKKLKQMEDYFDAYTARQKEIQQLENEGIKSLNQSSVFNKEIEELSKKLKELPEDVDPTTEEFRELLETIRKIRGNFAEIENQELLGKAKEDIKETNKNVEKLNKAEGKHEQTLSKKIITSLSYYTVLNKVKQMYRDVIRVVTELDEAMTDIAVVTTMNRQEAWELTETFQNMAKEVGLTTTEVAKLSTEFFKQGRNLKDALELTEVAAKSALVASIDVNEAADYLTSAVNGFGLAADAAVDVADKLALLSATSATDFEEIAIALSKVSPVAQSAGVDLDFMIGVLATGLETTREAPENIGTAFKTIFARMRELTDIGKATEDGMSLNRVEKALQSIGVTLRAETGGFRDLDDVLVEVGRQWQNLDSYQQAYLATAIAGSRQQPRLLAIFNDFERTEELIQESREANGALEYQHMEYMEGMAVATTNLKTAWESVITTFTNSETIIGAIDALSYLITALTNIFKFFTENTVGVTVAVFALSVGLSNLIVSKTALISKTYLSIKTSLLEAAATTKNTVASLLFRKSMLLENATRSVNNKLGKAGITTDLSWTVAKKGLTVATTGFGKALLAVQAAAPWLLAAGLIIAGIALAVSNYANESERAEKRTSELNEEMKELNKTKFDNKQKVKEVESLINKYEELHNKIIKNNEDLSQMQEILEQIKAQDGAENFIFDVGGKLVYNQEAYETYMESLQKKETAINKELMEKFMEAYNLQPWKAKEDQFAKLFYNMGATAVEEFTKGMESSTEKDFIQEAGFNLISAVDPSKYMDSKYLRRDVAGYEFLKIGGFETPILLDTIYKDVYEKVFNQETYDEITGIINNEMKTLYESIESFPDSKETTAESVNSLLADLKKASDALSQYGIYTNKIASQNPLTSAIYELNSRGMSSDAISSYINSGYNITIVEKAFSDLVKGGVTKEGASKSLKEVLTAGSEALGQVINDVISQIDDPEKKQELENSINSLFAVDTNIISGSISNLNGMATKFTDLKEKLASGDANALQDLAEELGESGIETIQNYLNGDISVSDILNQQYEKETDSINKTIAVLERKKIVEEELSVAEEIQLNMLKLILENSEYINARLQERVALHKEINNLANSYTSATSLEASLLDIGVSAENPFVEMIGAWAREDFNNIELETANLVDNTAEDLKNQMQKLQEEGIMSEDGKMIMGKDLTAAQILMIENYDKLKAEAISYINTYSDVISKEIDRQNKLYETQKKLIEERYKTEIDGMKEAHNKKWSEIDYVNKLAESQEKVLKARLALVGASSSGSMSQIINSQKDLRAAQQDRQKMIEDELLKQAEEKLKREQEEKVAEVNQKQLEKTSELTEGVGNLANEMVNNTKLLRELNETLSGGSGLLTRGVQAGGFTRVLENEITGLR